MDVHVWEKKRSRQTLCLGTRGGGIGGGPALERKI